MVQSRVFSRPTEDGIQLLAFHPGGEKRTVSKLMGHSGETAVVEGGDKDDWAATFALSVRLLETGKG